MGQLASSGPTYRLSRSSVPLDFFSSHIYANKKWTGWAGRASTIVQGVRNATALMGEFGLASHGR